MTLLPKQPYIKDEKHRRFVASLACCVSGATDVQAAHIRHSSQAGMGRKPSDDRCVPLSCRHHKMQHDLGERIYWALSGIGIERALELAQDLYAVTGNHALASQAIREFRESAISHDEKIQPL